MKMFLLERGADEDEIFTVIVGPMWGVKYDFKVSKINLSELPHGTEHDFTTISGQPLKALVFPQGSFLAKGITAQYVRHP